MSEFNLRALVREVLDTSLLSDPSDLAAEVLRRVPEESTGDALSQAMRTFVRQVITESRVLSTSLPPATANAGRSWKVQAVRDSWRRALNDPIHADGRWLRLREATRADLLAAAAECRQKADQNNAKARRYAAIARALQEHDVETVAQLPVPAMEQVLGVAA